MLIFLLIFFLEECRKIVFFLTYSEGFISFYLRNYKVFTSFKNLQFLIYLYFFNRCRRIHLSPCSQSFPIFWRGDLLIVSFLELGFLSKFKFPLIGFYRSNLLCRSVLMALLEEKGFKILREKVNWMKKRVISRQSRFWFYEIWLLLWSSVFS